LELCCVQARYLSFGSAVPMGNMLAARRPRLCPSASCQTAGSHPAHMAAPLPFAPLRPAGGGGAERQHGARVLSRRHPLPLPAQAAAPDWGHQCV
jgi:hypothetical protein